MTDAQQRKEILAHAQNAKDRGVSWHAVAECIGLSERTLRNWMDQGQGTADKRPEAIRPCQANAFTLGERQRIIEIVNSPKFASLPPEQIATIMTDRGEYIGSASTIYRVLREREMLKHRGRAREPKRRPKPSTRMAKRVDQIWSVDITYLPTNVNGKFLKLYMILDLYSRDIVGWEVFQEENSENSQMVLQKATIRHKTRPEVLHADNGSPFKNHNLHAMMLSRGIIPSHSRARVSNDNAYSEALFRTVKYHPSLPEKPFEGLMDAREWVQKFVHWYRHEHRHKGINMVTPAQKHAGEDIKILARRKANLEAAKAAKPDRWIGNKNTRNCTPTEGVTINSIRPDTREIEREIKKVA